MNSTNKNFKRSDPELEKKIGDLVGQMTLEEKIDMISGHPQHGSTRAIERLGIPEFKMADGPAGVHWWTERSTTYPALIMAAASWDKDLVEKIGIGLGRDCLSRGVHILLAPGVNIYRSPLCGRNFEYLGEDPYLSSRMAVAYVRGVQSQGVSTTVKHYAVNFQEYERHHVSSDLDERTLREIYLPAFKAAIQEGGSGCLMTSYNLVNGVHTSEHPFLIDGILKNEWGFDGVAMSDWASVYDAVNPVNAGLDLEMPTGKFMNSETLVPAVRDGRVSEKKIDDKIRRILRLAFCFGWIGREQKDPCIPESDPETIRISLDAARAGIVLLKNDKAVLPFKQENLRKVAVIGPSAHPANIGGGGSAYNNPSHTVSILEGIRHQLGSSAEVFHAAGVRPTRRFKSFATSEFFSGKDDKGLAGEYFNNLDLSGEAAVKRLDKQVNFWWGWMPPAEGITPKAYSVRWTGWLKPEKTGPYSLYVMSQFVDYRIWIDGKLVIDNWEKNLSKDAEGEVGLKAGSAAQVKIELRRKVSDWVEFHFGFEPAGSEKEEFAEALTLVKTADAVVVAAGFDRFSEGEGADRGFGLDKLQEKLIVETARLNPNTVVVLTAGGGVDMTKWLPKVKGLLLAWYPGQEGGTAVAEALFGALNPSGKLPATFEKKLKDRGSFDNYHDSDKDKKVFLKDGVFTGYRHFDRKKIKPLFPFGFGLSYTTFGYENLTLSSDRFDPKNGITVSFDIVNTGKREGAESCQVYVRDVESSVPRPVKELKGFAKVFLKPGERTTVKIVLGREALEFWHPQTKAWTAEPGEFEVLVGASCTDIRLKASFTL